ncbi:class I SAM-dependent methyltransferase [Candidatus Peregrinibacteria bacterium]|jgi:SAM-dependent methyltransferase|nr:class I SAM-dependent methyltransferase [Candidatus Peregrinibacteria bacterium]
MSPSKKYTRPTTIPSDMGGGDCGLDARLNGVLQLLECAPLEAVKTILDIGFGKGQLSKWLAKRDKKVTGTGLALDSYEIDIKDLKNNYNIDVAECAVEDMPFENKSFDAAVMSHLLEHVPNVETSLKEVHRVLKDDGYLFIFVPPHDDYICSGHLNMGWNIGQLMYVLLVNGFNVKDGNFIEYKDSVCGFVKKSTKELPALRGDRGDINILAQHDLWPLPIKTRDGFNDGFYGKLTAVNWLDPKFFTKASFLNKALRFVAKHTPYRIKNILRGLLSDGRVNPSNLKL